MRWLGRGALDIDLSRDRAAHSLLPPGVPTTPPSDPAPTDEAAPRRTVRRPAQTPAPQERPLTPADVASAAATLDRLLRAVEDGEVAATAAQVAYLRDARGALAALSPSAGA